MKIQNRLDMLRDIDKLVGLEFATTIDDKNAKCQYWQEGFVSVAEFEDILNSRLISIRNMIDILGHIKELSNNTLQLRDELEYELQTIKDYLKELQKETQDDGCSK